HPERRRGEAQRGKLLEARSELDAADPSVKKRNVHRISGVLVVLEPVAGVEELEGHQLVVRWKHPAVVDRQLRHVLGRTEIGENQVAVLPGRVGAMTENEANTAGWRLCGGLEDRSVHVVEPAVITAADAALRDDAVLERGAAMAAVAVQEADASAVVAK